MPADPHAPRTAAEIAREIAEALRTVWVQRAYHAIDRDHATSVIADALAEARAAGALDQRTDDRRIV